MDYKEHTKTSLKKKGHGTKHNDPVQSPKFAKIQGKGGVNIVFHLAVIFRVSNFFFQRDFQKKKYFAVKIAKFVGQSLRGKNICPSPPINTLGPAYSPR